MRLSLIMIRSRNTNEHSLKRTLIWFASSETLASKFFFSDEDVELSYTLRRAASFDGSLLSSVENDAWTSYGSGVPASMRVFYTTKKQIDNKE